MAFGHPETHPFLPDPEHCRLCGLGPDAPRHEGHIRPSSGSPTAEEFEQLIEISDEFQIGSFTTDAAGRPFDPELRIPRIPTSEAIWPQVREILGLPHDRFTPIRIEIDETGAFCHTSIFLTATELAMLGDLAATAGFDTPKDI